MSATRAADNHQRAIDEGMTCIDCHQGIAHDLPPDNLEEYRHVVETLAMETRTPAAEVAQIKSYLGTPAD
ncbi:NapC/NirT family cytochrome c [Leisingera daeponensis]|uniref:NapC/NirT family cytochrome c n=1 Tax=Leisingera daeponensis TaxID=405746 RepID=UPI00396568B4